MLELKITKEYFDESTEEFFSETTTLVLEHSLLSVSKWESITEKPFLSDVDKTLEETIEYIKAMVISPDVPPEIFDYLSQEDVTAVDAYINSKQTATWFGETRVDRSRATVTNEVIYSWMVALKIPFECQHWHLNRLFTLIRIRNEQLSPKRDLSMQEVAERNARLNAERKAALGTTG